MNIETSLICNMLGCNSEAFAQVMHYYFEEGKHPFAKCIMRFCNTHAKMISEDDCTTRVQVQN